MKEATVTYTDSNGKPVTKVLGSPSPLCAKCGTRVATQEVMVMTERPSGTVGYCDECAKGPQWSTEPPREPGWWWRRRQMRKCPTEYCKPHVVQVYHRDGALWDDFGEIPKSGDEFLQWYPVPIEPPK